MKQTLVTFVSRVDPGKVSDLKALLNGIGNDVDNSTDLPFSNLKLLHFASLVLNEDPSYGPYLVFENNFDGPLDNYLGELYLQAADGLHRIYSCCTDYSASSAADREQIISYLSNHAVPPRAYHIGAVGRSAERIRQEDSLRDGLETFLDGLVRIGRNLDSPAAIRNEVQNFVRSQPLFAWAATFQPRQTFGERVIPWLKIVVVVAIALLLLPILLPAGLIWAVVLRHKEQTDPPPADVDKVHVKELVGREDFPSIVQNHMTSIYLVKPGPFRRLTLKSVLRLVNLVARISTKGTLSGIPSIHFAHWSLIDNGRRLLFVSNFDGSWENYLDDFIDKASIGLTAIWSNTVGFPRSRFLLFEGARDGVRFKAFARDTQTYTNVWYSAYKQLTVETIDNNSRIREDLFSSLDETAIRKWVWRF